MKTLQELIDMPAFGSAEVHLRKHGKWCENALLTGAHKMSVTVEVSGYYAPDLEMESYTVIASTEKEAIDKAHNMCDFDDITSTQVSSVKEIN